MADNVELQPGSGGDIIAADDDGVAKHQYFKAEFGGDGTFTKVTSSTGLPVKVVEGITPGTGATDLGKAEDAVHSSGDVGVMSLGVRMDTIAALAADGDYTPLQTDEDGALWSHEKPNEVDSGNSSATPLGISGVFTGTGIDVLDHAAITVQVWADEDSAADGMQFQFSIDGTNWDVEHLHTLTAADGGRIFTFSAHSQFFRLIYTNGTTGQGAFRLETLLHHVSPITTIHRLVDAVSPDESSTLQKSAIIAQAAGSGDFVPVQSTAAGNLKSSVEEFDASLVGGGVEAGALLVTMASDSTGVLSVDDNGGSLTVDNSGLTSLDGAISGTEVQVDVVAALPAGTNAIGKLAANSGVDIGDVDVTSVVPGTGATNLGKAIDSVVGGTDTGVAMLGKHNAAGARLSTADNDYDIPRLSEFGAQLTEPEQHLVIDEMDALTAGGGTWAAIDSDTTGVALSTKHVLGAGSIEFDKVDGAANSGIGGITKALTAIDLSGLSPHDILQTVVYVGDTTDLDGGSSYVFLRLGTNSTDYNEWRIDSANLTAGIWETLAFEIGDASFVGQGGDGITWTAITYIAVGFKFDAVGDTLANIYVDEISFHTNQHVNAAINAEITSDISSANVNIHKVGNKIVNTQAGNVSTGTQRVTIADDDTNLATLSGAVSGTEMQVDIVSDGAGLALAANQSARATGGHSFYLNQDTNAVAAVKASAGTVYWIACMSIDATPVYLNLYDVAAGSVTLGSTTPGLQFIVPSQGDANGSGFTINFGPHGIQFSTAITVACATTFDGSGDPGANVVITNIGYE